MATNQFLRRAITSIAHRATCHYGCKPVRNVSQTSCLSTSCKYSKDSVNSRNTNPKLSNEEENWRSRVDLAAAYQLCSHEGLQEGIDNYLTLRAPSSNNNREVMLIAPYGLHWSQVTASKLIGVDFKTGNTVEGHGDVMPIAFCVHRAVHAARPGDMSNCVMHTDQPWATAVACVKNTGFLMLHQNATRFADKIAYHQESDSFADLSGNLKEGDKMAQEFIEKKGTKLVEMFKHHEIMFQGNQGVFAIGPTVAYAFNTLYFLEKSCEIQQLAQSSGREVIELPKDMVEKMKVTWPKYDDLMPIFFNGMKEVLIEKGSKFMT